MHPVIVRVGANITGFLAGMRAAGASAAGLAGSMAQYGATTERHLNKVSKVAVGVGAAMVGVGVFAAKSAAEFERGMSAVAATGTEAKASLGQLEEAALHAGKTTQYNATQAAGAIEDMIKAGVSAKDVIGGGLTGALNLAAAGTLDTAKAAELAATAMSQFQLAGKDVPHIADLLAAGAGKAQGTVEQLGFALKYVGPVAHGMNVSIEETIGTLALFASRGILGEQAGTSLRGVLLALTSPSKVAANAMADLGINMYNSRGKFIGLEGAAEVLHKQMKGLTDTERDYAFGRIFGNAQVTAARILYEQGGKAVADWKDKVNDAGFAEDAAKTRLDNLMGDLTKLKNQFQTALIGGGQGAQGPLRELTQTVTGLVEAFNNLSPAAQGGLVKVAVQIGAVLLVAGGLAKVVSMLGAVRTAMLGIGLAGPNVTRGAAAIRGLGAAAGVAAVAFVALSAASSAIESLSGKIPKVSELALQLGELGKGTAVGKKSLDELFSGIRTKSDLGIGEEQLHGFAGAVDEVFKNRSGVEKIGDSIDRFLGKIGVGSTGTVKQFEDRLVAVDEALVNMRANGLDTDAAFRQIATTFRGAGLGADEIIHKFPQLLAQFQQQAAQLKVTNLSADDYLRWMTTGVAPAAIKAADSTGKFNDETGKIPAQLKKAQVSLEDSIKSLREYGDALLTASGSAIDFEQAVDDAFKTIRENGKIIDPTTGLIDIDRQKGRDNARALNAILASTKQAIDDAALAGSSQNTLNGIMEKGARAYRHAAGEAGQLNAVTEGMIATQLKVPKQVTTKYASAGAHLSATEAIKLTEYVKGIPQEWRSKVIVYGEEHGLKAAKQHVAELKDKRVIAKVDGDISGAQEVKDIMGELKDRRVKAEARGDHKAVDKLDEAMRRLKNKTVYVNTVVQTHYRLPEYAKKAAAPNAGPTRYGPMRFTIAEGGYVSHDGVVRAKRMVRGGPVWGAGTATSDSIDAKLSHGEYVVNAAATRANRRALDMMNFQRQVLDVRPVRRYAEGGPVIDTDLQQQLLNAMGPASRPAAQVQLTIVNPLNEPTSASIATAAGYLAMN